MYAGVQFGRTQVFKLAGSTVFVSFQMYFNEFMYVRFCSYLQSISNTYCKLTISNGSILNRFVVMNESGENICHYGINCTGSNLYYFSLQFVI